MSATTHPGREAHLADRLAAPGGAAARERIRRLKVGCLPAAGLGGSPVRRACRPREEEQFKMQRGELQPQQVKQRWRRRRQRAAHSFTPTKLLTYRAAGSRCPYFSGQRAFCSVRAGACRTRARPLPHVPGNPSAREESARPLPPLTPPHLLAVGGEGAFTVHSIVSVLTVCCLSSEKRRRREGVETCLRTSARGGGDRPHGGAPGLMQQPGRGCRGAGPCNRACQER